MCSLHQYKIWNLLKIWNLKAKHNYYVQFEPNRSLSRHCVAPVQRSHEPLRKFFPFALLILAFALLLFRTRIKINRFDSDYEGTGVDMVIEHVWCKSSVRVELVGTTNASRFLRCPFEPFGYVEWVAEDAVAPGFDVLPIVCTLTRSGIFVISGESLSFRKRGSKAPPGAWPRSLWRYREILVPCAFEIPMECFHANVFDANRNLFKIASDSWIKSDLLNIIWMGKGGIKVGEHNLFKTCKIPLFTISGMCFKASIPILRNLFNYVAIKHASK